MRHMQVRFLGYAYSWGGLIANNTTKSSSLNILISVAASQFASTCPIHDSLFFTQWPITSKLRKNYKTNLVIYLIKMLHILRKSELMEKTVYINFWIFFIWYLFITEKCRPWWRMLHFDLTWLWHSQGLKADLPVQVHLLIIQCK